MENYDALAKFAQEVNRLRLFDINRNVAMRDHAIDTFYRTCPKMSHKLALIRGDAKIRLKGRINDIGTGGLRSRLWATARRKYAHRRGKPSSGNENGRGEAQVALKAGF